MSTATDPYPAGQCTAYVKAQAPWIPWFPGVGGNAGEWLGSATAAGFATSSSAVLGAIAVWRPGVGGASPFGHVAMVTGLDPLTVTGEDWPEGAGPLAYVIGAPGSPGAPSGFILPPAEDSSPMTAAERADLAGALVAVLYSDTLHRDADGDPAGRDFWIGQMTGPAGFRQTTRAFLANPESRTDVAVEAAGG